MSSVDKHIKDLIQFYVKENYKHYLTKNNITHIMKTFAAALVIVAAKAVSVESFEDLPHPSA